MQALLEQIGCSTVALELVGFGFYEERCESSFRIYESEHKPLEIKIFENVEMHFLCHERFGMGIIFSM